MRHHCSTNEQRRADETFSFWKFERAQVARPVAALVDGAQVGGQEVITGVGRPPRYSLVVDCEPYPKPRVFRTRRCKACDASTSWRCRGLAQSVSERDPVAMDVPRARGTSVAGWRTARSFPRKQSQIRAELLEQHRQIRAQIEQTRQARSRRRFLSDDLLKACRTSQVSSNGTTPRNDAS